MITNKIPDPYVSIIIPTQNNERDLIDCLDSIIHFSYPLIKIEVIIWDNNSNKENKTIVKEHLAYILKEKPVKIEFIEHNDNFGVYTSRDELFKRIRPDTEFVLSIDDDVILPPELLIKLLDIARQDESIGIIGPRTVFDKYPTETAHGAGFINWWLGRYIDIDTMETVECDYVIGCCMLIKKSVIDGIGGFDRGYYTSHGEVDFCIKAKNRKYKVLYYPELSVRHRVNRGGTKTLERTYYLFRNKIFVIKKNAPIPQKWICMALYLILWLPKAIIDSIIGNKGLNLSELRTIIKAMLDGWMNRTGKRNVQVV